MKQIRTSVFETNSSMTHCCVLTTEDNMKAWAEDKKLFCEDTEEFLDAESAFQENIKILEEKVKSDYCTFTQEKLDQYKRKELPLADLFPKYKYEMKELFLTSEEWDMVLEDGNYEFWEARKELPTNPPTTVVAFGYLGADY